MGSMFGKKPKKPKEAPPHAAQTDATLREMFEDQRVYTAMDAALGIMPKRRANERTAR